MELIPFSSSTSTSKLSSKEIQCIITLALLELYFNNDDEIISKFTNFFDKQLKTSVDDFKFKNGFVIDDFKKKLQETKRNATNMDVSLPSTTEMQNYDNQQIVQHLQKMGGNNGHIGGLPISMYQLNYSESRILGKGAFGEVCKSYHKIEKKFFAIKKIPLFDENVLNEVQIMTTLNHENVVKYYSSWIDVKNDVDCDASDGQQLLLTDGNSYSSSVEIAEPFDAYPFTLFIQMELCDKTLKEWLIESGSSAVVADGHKLSLFLGIAHGLQHIHKNNIIHRDLKPDNIFVTTNGSVIVAKIGDLGLSKKVDEGSFHNGLSQSMNNLIYYAPEIANNEYDFSCDIYSLGMILLEMMLPNTKTVFEKRKKMMEIRDGYVPFEHVCGKLIQKMIAKVPTDRPTIDEVIVEVELLTTLL